MTPSNAIPAVCNYGTSAVYSDYPSPEQLRAGVVPLDSLPAAWWNKMWCASNCAINEARDMVGQIITEVNNVLCQAGINPQSACTDQLYQSINKIRQTLATASVPGAVVSSSDASKVAVAADGTMSVNCLGNAASLTTSASTVVGAINELKSTYDCCFSDTATALGGKAPTSHASSATSYGVGSADNYGHLKISDTYTSVLAACSGVAASQKALACVYAVACAAAAGNVSLGNTAGCALGTAAAGTAITAARSDHVHPLPSCVTDKYGSSTIGIGYACAGLTCAQLANLAAFSTSYTSGCTVIKDVSKATVQCWLGLGGAAYCAATAFRPSTWTPTCVPYAVTGGYLGERAALGCAPNCIYGVANIWNYCNDSRYYLIGTKYDNAACKYNVRVDYATSATKACCASYNGSGVAFGSAATCAASCFRPADWWPSSVTQGRVGCATLAILAGSAGKLCTFGQAVGIRNEQMRQWSVTWQGIEDPYTPALHCDIYKAICWATDNATKFGIMGIFGSTGCSHDMDIAYVRALERTCDLTKYCIYHVSSSYPTVICCCCSVPAAASGCGRIGGVY